VSARYRLHGYSIRSTFGLDLPEDPAPPADGGDTLRLGRGADRPVPAAPPGPRLLAELADDGLRTYYQFARTDDGVVLRFRGLADFVGDHGLSEVTVHVDPAADPGLLSVLVGGSVIATRLLLDGRLVLHASALRVGPGAVAFVGRSGMGKSTMAALGMSCGYLPITDDVLRIDLDGTGGGARAWPGGTELRLRETARRLAPTGGPVRTTADGRTALATGAVVEGPMPLRCCVVPLLDPRATELDVRLLAPSAALLWLLSAPRVVGWQDPETSAQQFHLLASLCERTPVIEARVPWGSAVPDQLVDGLFDRIDELLDISLRGPTP
jgi:hypothetical protein